MPTTKMKTTFTNIVTGCGFSEDNFIFKDFENSQAPCLLIIRRDGNVMAVTSEKEALAAAYYYQKYKDFLTTHKQYDPLLHQARQGMFLAGFLFDEGITDGNLLPTPNGKLNVYLDRNRLSIRTGSGKELIKNYVVETQCDIEENAYWWLFEEYGLEIGEHFFKFQGPLLHSIERAPLPICRAIHRLSRELIEGHPLFTPLRAEHTTDKIEAMLKAEHDIKPIENIGERLVRNIYRMEI